MPDSVKDTFKEDIRVAVLIYLQTLGGRFILSPSPFDGKVMHLFGSEGSCLSKRRVIKSFGGTMG